MAVVQKLVTRQSLHLNKSYCMYCMQKKIQLTMVGLDFMACPNNKSIPLLIITYNTDICLLALIILNESYVSLFVNCSVLVA